MLHAVRTLFVAWTFLAPSRRPARPRLTVVTPRAPERLTLARVAPPRARAAAALLAVAPVLVTVAACSSGGGGGGGTTITTPVSPPVSPPAPPPPPPPPPPPVTPSSTSAEYTRSYGLAAIHADAAYAAGASGAGIVVAVVDSGVKANPPDLAGNISPLSTDIITARNQPYGVDPHATYVAGVLASTFNGAGTIGVAYNATVLSIRADKNDPSCTDSCSFDDDDVGRGIDYAVSHGARIINLSLGGDGESGTIFQQALQRAVQAGVVVAISAGNESGANPTYPAFYAVDPRYMGAVVAVGSVDANANLSSFSNKAGAAAAGYVTAPGDKVVSNCDGTNCYILSGTSFAAPHVAGALALLLQAFPNLTGRQALSLLLTTSTDLGAPGVDTTYGYGEINLARAFAPAGAVTTQSVSGAAVAAQAVSAVRLGQAFGDAVRRTSALQTVGFDAYNRRYAIDLATRYHGSGASSLQDWLTPAQETTASDLALPAGGMLHLSTSRGETRSEQEQRFGQSYQREAASDLSVRMTSGRFAFTAWRGVGGSSAAPGLAASEDAFASLTRPTIAARSEIALGFGELSVESGSGERRQLLGVPEQDPSRYRLASFTRARGDLFGRLSFGAVQEPAGPLGSTLPAGAAGLSMPSRTSFGSTHLDWRAAPGVVVSADAALGATRAAGFVGLDGPVWSSTWRLGARSVCEGSGCVVFSASLEQPLRTEAGRFTATLADVPADYSDPLSFSTRHFSAAPSGRELDFKVGASGSIDHAGDWRLLAVAMHDEGQVAGAPLNLGLIGTWRAKW